MGLLHAAGALVAILAEAHQSLQVFDPFRPDDFRAFIQDEAEPGAAQRLCEAGLGSIHQLSAPGEQVAGRASKGWEEFTFESPVFVFLSTKFIVQSNAKVRVRANGKSSSQDVADDPAIWLGTIAAASAIGHCPPETSKAI
mmetsp:Transcript_28187/g.66991  ORF Transcript_28187/g.66991 Transcript_28187/m.66991 type:complete len:141 (+) Transcript_28187:1109-1531(+)